MSRLLLLVLLGLLSLSAGAQDEDAGLADNQLYQAALRAMEGEQPGIAAQRFNELLGSLPPDAPERREVLLRIGEALVRAGDSEQALPVLQDPLLAAEDEAIFWTAAAQAVSGRLKDAADSLARLNDSENTGLRLRALLNRARILASLGSTADAEALLKLVAAGADPKLAARAQLLQASVLLEVKALDEALALLDMIGDDDPLITKAVLFLRARHAMATEDFAEAHRQFRTLLDDPVHLTQAMFRSVTLGDADALHALGKDAEAISLLLSHAEARPGSAFLEPVLARLANWSAGDDSLRSQLRTRLVKWIDTDDTTENSLLRTAGIPTGANQTLDPGLTRTNLGAFARYHLALLLAEENETESVTRARSLLHHLRLDYPTHPLAKRSLLETSRLFLAEKKPEMALHTLRSLSAIAQSPALKASAAELTARVEFAQGDYAEAAGAFARARENLQVDDRYFTAINHGLSLLEAGNDEGFAELLASIEDPEAARALALEQALVMAARSDPRAAPLLDLYLRRHPDSPRLVEARLALAEVSLLPEVRDLSMASAQLDSVEALQLTQPFALRHLLARLRLADLSGSWETAITEATDYIRTHEAPTDAAVLLKLGEAYYKNGDYNDARIQFLQAAKKKAAPELQEVARFYAAKAAMRIGTTGSRDDAISLFTEVVESGSLLAGDARIQLTRAQLDAARPEEALQVLEPLLEPDDDGPAGIDSRILSAEAYRLRAQPGDLARCLEIYDSLLEREDIDYRLSNRLHFLKGLTYEQLRQPAEAFDAYYRVINGDNLGKGEAITEWKWYYDCGFSALRLLEEAKRWRAAYGVARTLAESGGPRAEQAARRAQKLQLDHMIWDTK